MKKLLSSSLVNNKLSNHEKEKLNFITSDYSGK